MKTLSDFDLRGKTVLLRADLNSDVRTQGFLPTSFKNGKVVLGERIIQAAGSILKLKKAGARVVVLAHQGTRPKGLRRGFGVSGFRGFGGGGDFLSLRQHSKFLNKYVKVKFVEDVCGAKAVGAIGKMKDGEVVLLDNVRFVEDEFKPKKKGNVLLKNLMPLFDLYVNDAFSVCHREHTSIVGFAGGMPSCAGPLLEKELKALDKIKLKKCLCILGGAKPESNMRLLVAGRRSSVVGCRKVLACGLFGQTCVVAKGKDLGYQNKYLRENVLVKGGYEKFLKILKSRLRRVRLPVDFAVAENGKRVEYSLDEFPLDYEIMDIGAETLKEYIKEIRKAKMIYVKGPAGFVGDAKFEKGTVEILKAVAGAKGFSIVGGGHLSDVIARHKLKGFGHVSLSGGALVRYIAGEKLPGLEVL